jgi:rod shape-determining protein MreB and related proteins
MDLDVHIYKDRIVVTKDSGSQSFFPATDYSTQRLLVGNFTAAQVCLRAAVKEMGGLNPFRFSSLTLRIHPRECIEGGMSEIETRILKELGHGAGAKKVEVILNGQAV